MDLDLTTEVAISEGIVALGDLLGSDVSAVSPFFGFEKFPEGLYDWTLKDADITVRDTKNGKMACIYFEWIATNVHTLKDASIDPAEVLGREYMDNIFVHDPMRAIGQARAIIEQAGGSWGTSLPDNLAAFKAAAPGVTFGITQSKDKNDPDKVYSNTDMRSIKPLVKAAA